MLCNPGLLKFWYDLGEDDWGWYSLNYGVIASIVFSMTTNGISVELLADGNYLLMITIYSLEVYRTN
jgi:hypothetical protein